MLNWLLDYIALLPFTKQSLPRYFAEIGLRYLAIAAPTVALGYVLERRAAAYEAICVRCSTCSCTRSIAAR